MANKKTDSTKSKTVQKPKRPVKVEKVEKVIEEENKKEKEIKVVDTKKPWIKNKVTITMLIMIALTVLLTWIVKTSSFSGEDVIVGERAQTGLFDIFKYFKDVFTLGSSTAIYILVIGGFYAILYKTGAYRKLLNRIVESFKGIETIFLIITIVLLAVLTSICGASLALLMIVPLLISVITMMGYDRKTAALTTIGAIAVGLIGTTLSSTLADDGYNLIASNNTGIINGIFTNILQQSGSTLSVIAKDYLLIKIGVLLLGIGLLILNVILHIKRTTTSNNETIFTPMVVDENKKNWPLIVIIDLTILIALLSVISWTTSLNVSWFTKATVAVQTFTIASIPVSAILLIIANCLLFIKKPLLRKVILLIDVACAGLIIIGLLLNGIFKISLINKIFGFSISSIPLVGKIFDPAKAFGAFPLFGKIFGTINEFGNWSVTEFSTLLIVMSCVTALIYKIRFSEFVSTFIEGAKRAIKPATMVMLSYLVLVIVAYSPIVLTIVNPLIGTKLNAFTMSITAFVTSLFNVDFVYSAPSVIQTIGYKYLATLKTATAALPTLKATALIWQAMSGFATLVAPTSIILMATLSYLHISYIEWIKASWKFILELLLVLMAILTIVVILL